METLSINDNNSIFNICIECSFLDLNDEELYDFMLKKAKLWLNKGAIFGTGGSMFMSVNIACPRSILKKALENLEKAVNEHIVQ